MEHYYDEPTRVPSYQKKRYRTDSMGFLNHVDILKKFTLKYGLSSPQYAVYPDPNLKTKLFLLAQININDHIIKQAGPTSKLAKNRASLKLLILYHAKIPVDTVTLECILQKNAVEEIFFKVDK